VLASRGRVRPQWASGCSNGQSTLATAGALAAFCPLGISGAAPHRRLLRRGATASALRRCGGESQRVSRRFRGAPSLLRQFLRGWRWPSSGSGRWPSHTSSTAPAIFPPLALAPADAFTVDLDRSVLADVAFAIRRQRDRAGRSWVGEPPRVRWAGRRSQPHARTACCSCSGWAFFFLSLALTLIRAAHHAAPNRLALTDPQLSHCCPLPLASTVRASSPHVRGHGGRSRRSTLGPCLDRVPGRRRRSQRATALVCAVVCRGGGLMTPGEHRGRGRAVWGCSSSWPRAAACPRCRAPPVAIVTGVDDLCAALVALGCLALAAARAPGGRRPCMRRGGDSVCSARRRHPAYPSLRRIVRFFSPDRNQHGKRFSTCSCVRGTGSC